MSIQNPGFSPEPPKSGVPKAFGFTKAKRPPGPKKRLRRSSFGSIDMLNGKHVIAWFEKDHIHFHIQGDKGTYLKPVSVKELFREKAKPMVQTDLPLS